MKREKNTCSHTYKESRGTDCTLCAYPLALEKQRKDWAGHPSAAVHRKTMRTDRKESKLHTKKEEKTVSLQHKHRLSVVVGRVWCKDT